MLHCNIVRSTFSPLTEYEHNCDQLHATAEFPDRAVNYNLLKFYLIFSGEKATSEGHFVIQIPGKALGLPRPATGPVHGTGLAKFIAAGTGTLAGPATPATKHGQFTPEVLQNHFGFSTFQRRPCQSISAFGVPLRYKPWSPSSNTAQQP